MGSGYPGTWVLSCSSVRVQYSSSVSYGGIIACYTLGWAKTTAVKFDPCLWLRPTSKPDSHSWLGFLSITPKHREWRHGPRRTQRPIEARRWDSIHLAKPAASRYTTEYSERAAQAISHGKDSVPPKPPFTPPLTTNLAWTSSRKDTANRGHMMDSSSSNSSSPVRVTQTATQKLPKNTGGSEENISNCKRLYRILNTKPYSIVHQVKASRALSQAAGFAAVATSWAWTKRCTMESWPPLKPFMGAIPRTRFEQGWRCLYPGSF